MGTVRTNCLGMKVLAVIACFGLIALANGAQKLVKSEQCGPHETSCPAGCCPDNLYCAATAADCPFVSMKTKLAKMAANKQCGPNEVWFCCPANLSCAATAADCPFVSMKTKLAKMAANKQCGPHETSCPAGCCPNEGWFCCPDNLYCA